MASNKRFRYYRGYYIRWVHTGPDDDGYWEVYDSQMNPLGLNLNDGELEQGLREYEEA